MLEAPLLTPYQRGIKNAHLLFAESSPTMLDARECVQPWLSLHQGNRVSVVGERQIVKFVGRQPSAIVTMNADDED
ncbi:MAG: hypothetical protein JXO22_13525 [Phycisphaerae bacterium]|nr:hypothetical protein [Phycisphaerae bacterium]